MYFIYLKVQKKARKKDRYETSDEKAALEYYEMLKGGRHKAVAKDNENDQQERCGKTLQFSWITFLLNFTNFYSAH